MNIQEFVRESLCQIMGGTKEAREKHASIAPKYDLHYDTKVPSGTIMDTGGQLLFLVDFDLAVTATEEKGQSGKAGLAIQIVSAGGEKTSSASTTSVTRVKFCVPISYGHQ